MQLTKSAITTPKGFKATGIHCGLKKNNAPDLALVISESAAQVAGVYTQNLVKGHSLQRTIHLVSTYPTTRGVFINSGNANACVGPSGYNDAQDIASMISSPLGIKSDEILSCSTGVIGQPLNMTAIQSGIPTLIDSLSSSQEAGHEAMKSIMTTDLVPKESSVTIQIDGKEVTLSGMAKGSGMIHPNLATMIALITTDAQIQRPLLQQMLISVAGKTFNRITVDGDTSVCDTLLIMANGEANNREIEVGTKDADVFFEALLQICTDLARMMAKDGEGATKLVEVQVNGAATSEDAYLILLAVCRSPLCKTAIFGEDANWGRIITAVGYSGAVFNPEKIDISIGNLMVCQQGIALPFKEDQAKSLLSQSEITITIDLEEGTFCDRMWTCDFSYDYIKINGSYRS